MQARIAAIADCPSPLTRLGITRAQPQIVRREGGVVDLVIPSPQDAEGSVLRFKVKAGEGAKASNLFVTWSFEPSEVAAELDLGEDRLLNPVRLDKDLKEAVNAYLYFYAHPGISPNGSQDLKRQLAATCRTLGRLIDGVAITTNPALRATLEHQKRRDALGWLFKDNYQLRTDSPDGAYWEAPTDYQPGWE
ncbi:MAG: hypothetical protein ACKOPG_00350 [Novosphingobium sp.]